MDIIIKNVKLAEFNVNIATDFLNFVTKNINKSLMKS